MADTDTTHQGWKNYETWLAALHLNNEPWSYDSAREIVREGDPYGLVLQEFVEDLIIPYDQRFPSTFSELLRRDILTGWLQAVDWQEVAASFLDE